MRLYIGMMTVTTILCSFAVAADTTSDANSGITVFKTVSYNVMKFEGFPSESIRWQGSPRFESNDDIQARVRKQIPLRIAMEIGLYDPDIISLQEAAREESVKAIADYLGMRYVFFPGNGRWPGAVITRCKILESQQNPVVSGKCPAGLFTRHWGRVVLETQFGRVVVHTAHLHPIDRDIRSKEITEILKVIDNDVKAGYSVILQGDLNHRDNDPEYQRWVDGGLTDSFSKRVQGIHYTIPSNGPTKRIDFIWVKGPLEKSLAEYKVLYEGEFKLSPDEPMSFALSDHIPDLAIFQLPSKSTN